MSSLRPLTLGAVIAVLVLVACLVFALLHQLDYRVAVLVGLVALARLT